VPRKKHIHIVFAAVFAAFVLVPVAGAATKTSAATSLLQAVNRTRVTHGLRPLRLDATLARAARSHSVQMLRGDYFSHGDFHGRMVAFHVQGPAAGENLAWGSGSYGQPSTIVAEWLASPEHRANLLRPGWTRIGIGIVRGTFLGNGGSTVVTADFAGR
jgi:uncharacterized protein YkwD